MVEALDDLVRALVLMATIIFFLIDNSIVEDAFAKGNLSSSFLYPLILRLKLLQL